MTGQDDFADLDAALGNMRFRFWVCPTPGHSDRKGADGRPVATVEWRDGIAHCLHPHCDATSRPGYDRARSRAQSAPTVAEVVSATRTLLDALRYQPDEADVVVEARRKVEQVVDRYDASPRFKVTPLAVAASHAEVVDRHHRVVDAFEAQTSALEGDGQP